MRTLVVASFGSSRMITPALVKSKYLACLESKFLSFYPSILTLQRLGNSEHQFQVRLCPDLLKSKNETKTSRQDPNTKKPPSFNPFLPFDSNLWVADLKTLFHVLIFNKFCVLPEHLLVITRDFVPQSAPFCKEDFDAVEEVLSCLGENRPFAFYNSGPDAGASQLHRHFQVVGTDGNGAIIEKAIDACNEPAGTPFALPCFASFQHACIKLTSSGLSPLTAFSLLQSTFSPSVLAAFNLVWSREWMLLVPRRKECTDDGVNAPNALAFAGYLLVMQESQLHDWDVLSALEQVTFPK